MKKLITLSTICVIACILFSSCNSNLSITKRHYNNGYYVAYSNGKQIIPSSKEKGETKVIETDTVDPLYSLKKQSEQNTLIGYSEDGSIADDNDVVASNAKIQRKSISQKKIKQLLKPKAKILEYPASKINSPLFEGQKIKSAPHAEDGLSLFWLVIVILLILWVLGLLVGGFGGLLHILLVLALILFILWLLRLI